MRLPRRAQPVAGNDGPAAADSDGPEPAGRPDSSPAVLARDAAAPAGAGAGQAPQGGGPAEEGAGPAEEGAGPAEEAAGAGRQETSPRAHAATATVGIRVEDDLKPRVRMPADLLRCIVAAIEIVLVAGLARLGVEISAVSAAQHLPRVLLTIGSVAYIAALVLPVAMAAWLAMRGQWRRLAEAVLIAAVAVAAAALGNFVLRQPPFQTLDAVLAPLVNGVRLQPFDGLLSGLVAYTTVIGLAGRPRWRTGFWLVIGFYSVILIANSHATVFSLLITLLLGSVIGSGLRYAVGTGSDRPTAVKIAMALAPLDAPLAEIRRVPETGTENRRYVGITADGSRRDIIVFDRDQQAADALYRIYRRIRLQTQVSRTAILTVERAMERRALLTYAVEDAGVATPRLCALVRVGPEAAVLCYETCSGTRLAELDSAPTDEQLGRIWDTVLRLHGRRVTHRALTADRIVLAGRERRDVVLVEPGNGDLAATDLQLRLDLAQLLAELALAVGPDRAARLAMSRLRGDELAGLVSLLQPVVLQRSTRTALRQHKQVLPELRKRLLGSAPEAEAPPIQLERIRPRTLVTMVAGVVAIYLLLGQLKGYSFSSVLKHADWRWTLVAFVLSVTTYVGATLSLTGFVLEKLNMAQTFLAQVAGSFVTLVTPAAVGGVALNLRFLRKSGVAPAEAAASVGVSQVFAFALHILLLIIFAALTGRAEHSPLHIPGWVFIAIAVLVAAALTAFAFPAGRRLARSRLAPALGQVIPRLLDIAQRPVKLAEGVGGAFLLTATYILCLDASVRALGGSVALVSVAVVYLTGSAIGSAVPTPGGLGAVEAALSAGLTAAGLPGAKAISAVLLFRLLTFWLPVPLGWISMSYLQRHDAL
ncbi:MAG: flippase-like domain-containing protein [Streptosporangiaceae bacterium]